MYSNLQTGIVRSGKADSHQNKDEHSPQYAKNTSKPVLWEISGTAYKEKQGEQGHVNSNQCSCRHYGIYAQINQQDNSD